LIASHIDQLCWSMLFTPLQNFAYVDPLLRNRSMNYTFKAFP
jgi:hypothetical protein